MEYANAPRKNYKFKIGKMDCAACAATITDTAKRIEGVTDAKLNFINETLYVETESGKPSPEEIIKMIEFAGFEADLTDSGETTPNLIVNSDAASTASSAAVNSKNIKFKIEGMHCTNCAKAIEKDVGKLNGVNSIVVNFVGESGSVFYDPAITSKDVIFKAVVESGYTPIDEIEDENKESNIKHDTNEINETQNSVKKIRKRRKIPDWKKDLYWLIFTLIIAIPTVILTYIDTLGIYRILALFILATIVQFTAGLTFYKGAYDALKSLSYNMDVLVSLGIPAAYL